MDAPDITKLPDSWQNVVTALGFLVAMAAAAYGYFNRGKSQPTKVNEDVVVVGGAFTERSAVQSLADAIVAAAQAHARSVEAKIAADKIHADRLERIVERAVDRIEAALERHVKDASRAIEDVARDFKSGS